MATTASVQSITPKKLAEKYQAGEPIHLIDVRTPAEFREVHVTFAENRPLDQLDAKALAAAGSEAQPLYVICRSGNRASKACESLVQAGHTQVINVEGGTEAWVEAGLPVVRGKKTISLERQVRIAAGLLAFVGALLAIFVDVRFAWLSAFVGAGLMFAGITDTCGMAMILAKMPWNQVSVENKSASETRCDQDAPTSGATCCG